MGILKSLLIFFLMFGTVLGVSISARAEPPVTEYQVEAAFLYYFLQFVEWPEKDLPSSKTPYIIGILGKDPFGTDLAEILHNKTSNGREIRIEHVQRLEELRQCRLLFISSSEKGRLREIFQSLAGLSVLTVGGMEGFNEAGGMINFVLQEETVRFSINPEAAKNAGLKISARLLQIAIHLTEARTP